ncbi:MAG: hypothetical protein J5I81_14490 [Nitrococcus mobilis]|nr:hypothetical protein [Nitrococcus mobilis]
MSSTTATSSTDLFGQLTALNTELWKIWLEGPPRMLQGSSALDETYHSQIKGFRKAIEEMLQLEQRWVGEIRDHGPREGLGGEISRVSAALMEAGINTRSRLWQVWFDNAERLDVARLGNLTESMQTPQRLFTAWQQVADELFEVQRQVGREFDSASKAVSQPPAEAAAGKPRSGSSKAGSREAASSSP